MAAEQAGQPSDRDGDDQGRTQPVAPPPAPTEISVAVELADTVDLPKLRDPVLIAAFEGWNDAGDAASAAVEHLEVFWQATPLAAIDPEDYYDFQVNRPTVSLVADGGTRRIHWPTTRLSVAAIPGTERDAVLIRGLEPNMRWRTFAGELIDMCVEMGVRTSVTLGALLVDTPHTRPLPVSGSAGDDATTARLGLERSRYEGPTGIVAVFGEGCVEAGMATVSLWAGVPHYVAQPPSPKATLSLLRKLEDLLQVEVGSGDLTAAARDWQAGIDEMAEQDSEMADYVRALEEREPDVSLQDASGEELAREFEKFLRGDES